MAGKGQISNEKHPSRGNAGWICSRKQGRWWEYYSVVYLLVPLALQLEEPADHRGLIKPTCSEARGPLLTPPHILSPLAAGGFLCGSMNINNNGVQGLRDISFLEWARGWQVTLINKWVCCIKEKKSVSASVLHCKWSVVKIGSELEAVSFFNCPLLIIWYLSLYFLKENLKGFLGFLKTGAIIGL